MIKAIDSFGTSVSIDSAKEGKTYFCPICKQALIQKRGEIREHHFSHIGNRGSNSKNYTPCSDTWRYDKTDWHIQWQKRFPDECYEKVLEFEGRKHIADVLVGDVVVEFQHSSISVDEFRDRNDFYTKCGYKVIWVFDLIDELENGRITMDERNDYRFHWSYVKKFFREVELNNEKTIVFFQFYTNDEKCEDSCLERVSRAYNFFKTFYTDKSCCLTINDFVKKVKETPEFFFDKKVIREVTLNQSNSVRYVQGGKTLFELWKKNFSYMIVYNLEDGQEMLIHGKDGNMCRLGGKSYGEIIGKYSKRNYDGSYYYSSYYVVKKADKPIWKLKKADYEDMGGKTIKELLPFLYKTGKVLICLRTHKAYFLEFVNPERFNAYNMDLETGEIADDHSNREVYNDYYKRVWTLNE